VAALLRLGRAAEVIPQLEQLVAEHPLREGFAERLVLALNAAGRRAEALQAFEQARARIADQLGVDPSAGLRAAQLAVLAADGATQPPALATGGNRTNGTSSTDAPPGVDGAAGPGNGSIAPGPEDADRPPGWLPTALTSFVGRQQELKVVQELLDDARLVTLVGAGGSGKTRLAAEVAGRLADQMPGGAWLVELARWSDPAEVPQAVLGTISLRARSLLEASVAAGGDPLVRLLDGLAGRRALLVMDNCEHLIEATARVVEQLLTHCPGLTVLATSREPLGILGEAVLPVPPLAQPAADDPLLQALERPAVRLSADRAAAVQRGFTVNQDTLAAVVEICRRLDGLPLAIELAAARLRTLPVQVVAARLGDRFRLLTGGSRTAAPRHQTLRAVVAWSWDLLDDAERDLLERLSVFAGGISLDGAVALAAQPEPGEVLDRLSALADKSLLVPAGMAATGPDQASPRFRMLETIREFGLERLAARGAVAAARAAHARHFLELAEAAEPWLRRAEQVSWLNRLTAERDNLHAAIRFAADAGDCDTAVRLGAALAWYWTVIGDNSDAATWLGEALSVPGPAPAQARAIATVVHAIGLMNTDPAAARQQAELLHELIRRLPNPAGHPLLILVEPGLAMLDNDLSGALAALDRELAAAPADPWARAGLRMMRAVICENDGDVEAVRQDVPLALEGFRQVGDRWGMATTLTMVASLRSLDGDLAGALACYDEAVAMMSELNATDDVSYVLARMAALYGQLEDWPNAHRMASRAHELAERRGSAWAAASAQIALARVDRALGDREAARATVEQARLVMDAAVGAPPQPPRWSTPRSACWSWRTATWTGPPSGWRWPSGTPPPRGTCRCSPWWPPGWPPWPGRTAMPARRPNCSASPTRSAAWWISATANSPSWQTGPGPNSASRVTGTRTSEGPGCPGLSRWNGSPPGFRSCAGRRQPPAARTPPRCRPPRAATAAPGWRSVRRSSTPGPHPPGGSPG
jgi:predicted ATPase